MIVIDASVPLSWLFEDELDDFATQSAERVMRETALVPAIFPAEVANALLFAARKARVAESDVRGALDRIAELPIRVASTGLTLADEMDLAQRHGLTIYDAMYLALAKRHRTVLYTRDNALVRAARAEHLAVGQDEG
ncbi:MAG TPA: type II toxin-antitoxin system VapC family toxin [Candidatus Dormibacteraeota bacterium]|nr:type II toxin-antitoxin system VapC family toxin [Candidatus Dormibacteraeota bacterium]